MGRSILHGALYPVTFRNRDVFVVPRQRVSGLFANFFSISIGRPLRAFFLYT